jgi:copper chaperone NosL
MSVDENRFRRPVLLWVWCLMIAVAVFANCQRRTAEPVALAPEDMCSYCRMAISEKQYAAELIDSDGTAFKFDDIGCMVHFLQSGKSKTIAASFVMDFSERQWLKADDAFYVRSSEFTTPMNGGMVAFRTEAKAREAANKYNGTLLRFKDVLNR